MPSWAKSYFLPGGTMIATDIIRVAAQAEVDPRTVERYLDGKTLKPRTRRRVQEAMRALGYEK